jgi:hypothetical protein
MSDSRRLIPPPVPPEGGERRRLDRAPGERYAPGSSGIPKGRRGARSWSASAGGGGTFGPGGARAIVRAALAAGAGALLFVAVAQLGIAAGLLVVAAFSGWLTALALIWSGRGAVPSSRTRVGLAAFLGGQSMVLGLLIDWLYSLVQGGAMGPLAYVGELYGIVAILAMLLGAGVAAVRAR